MRQVYPKKYIMNNVNKEFESMGVFWHQPEATCRQYFLKMIPRDLFVVSKIMSISQIPLYHLVNEIRINLRKSIVELGSGVTTIFIALLMKELSLYVSFVSIDDKIECIVKTYGDVKKMGLEKFVNLLTIPLVEGQVSGNKLFKTSF